MIMIKTKIMKNLLVITALFSLLLLSASCNKTPLQPINAGADGIAIKGYDPVAYFTMGGPVKGSKEFSYAWNGATWLFSSKDHLDLFTGDPETYAPQYGGY